MKFTDSFINKPVLAIVVSLLILVLGIRAVSSLSVRQYPETQNATVTVTTAYYGADAATMAGFITQPLEQAVSQAQGIDYLSSSSVSGVSTITATLRLNYDANRALTEITTQVNSVKNQLPPQAQQPVLNVQTGETVDAMYIGFYSDVLPTNNITDYLARVVKPKLDALDGVQTAELLGARQFALRAWLDPARMAAHGVTASDVNAALAANNYLAAVGSSKGQAVTVDLTTDSSLHTVDEFKQLVVRQSGGAIVRLQDVATVSLGSENYDFNVAFNGKRSVFIGIKVAPDANVLDVAQRVRAVQQRQHRAAALRLALQRLARRRLHALQVLVGQQGDALVLQQVDARGPAGALGHVGQQAVVLDLDVLGQFLAPAAQALQRGVEVAAHDVQQVGVQQRIQPLVLALEIGRVRVHG